MSEGDRQYIIVQLLAEIKKLKEIMEVYIERQKKQREQNEKLLDELNKHKRQFQGTRQVQGGSPLIPCENQIPFLKAV